jgi:hypothetical protein
VGIQVAGADDYVPDELNPDLVGPSKDGRGHHWTPKSVFRELPFPSEVTKAFDEFTSGKLPKGVNIWNEEHLAYNEAVRERLMEFMARKNITPEQMTPELAREFVGEVLFSQDPRIKGFKEKIISGRKQIEAGKESGNEGARPRPGRSPRIVGGGGDEE